MNSYRTVEKSLGRERARLYGCQLILCQDAIARHLELTSSDLKCLTIIMCYGAMTPGKLATYTGFTTGGITRVIDHLEGRGFVRRRIDSTDRRTMTIEPLPSGKYTFGKQSVSFDPIIDALLERYDEKEFAVIVDFLGYGAELFQDMSQRLNAKT